MTSAFAAAYDEREPPSPDMVHAAIDGAGAPICQGPLTLAWTGSSAPVDTGDLLVYLHGTVYAIAGLREGPVATPQLAELWDAQGESLLPRLRGDFVLLVHDARRRRLLVARDQLGGRAAVWNERGSRLHVASDVADLLRLLPSRPAPDVVSVAHWLGVSGPPGDRTMFEGIQLVPRSGTLLAEGGRRSVGRYWTPAFRSPTGTPLEDAAVGLREQLQRAVERRCTEPDLTGVLLSGGLDSSSVAGIAGHLAPARRPRRAYSATFPDHPSVDEASLIDQTCRQVGLDGSAVVVRSGSVIAGAIPYLRRWQVPPVSPNLFFWSQLFELAQREGTSVLLDGEGGDELFGLSPYLIADRLRRGRLRAAADLVRVVPGGRPDLPRRTVRRYLWQWGAKGAVPLSVQRRLRRWNGVQRHVPSWFRRDTATAFMAGDIRDEWKSLPGPRWWAYLAHTVCISAASSILYDHVRQRGTMYGIDARHPLVDVDVIEYVLDLDPELAFDPRFSRPVQRQALTGLIPDAVRLRPAKSSFDAVFQASLTGPDLQVARTLLTESPEVAAFADPREIERRLLASPPGPGERVHWAVELWRLVTMEAWLRQEAGRPILEPADEARLARPEVAVRDAPPP